MKEQLQTITVELVIQILIKTMEMEDVSSRALVVPQDILFRVLQMITVELAHQV